MGLWGCSRVTPDVGKDLWKITCIGTADTLELTSQVKTMKHVSFLQRAVLLLFPSSAFHLLPNMLDFTAKAVKWIFLENNTFQVITEFSAEEETDHRVGGHTSGSKSQLPCCPCLDGIDACRGPAMSWVPVSGGRGGGHLAS